MQTFPNLSLQLLDQGQKRLSDFSSPYTLLVFYRGFHCRSCFRYIRKWASLYSSFKKAGIEVVAISTDPKEKALQTQREWFTASLPLAHSFSVEEGRQLGLHHSKGNGSTEPEQYLEPAVFLLDQHQKVVFRSIQDSPYGRPDVEALLQDLQSLTAKTLKPATFSFKQKISQLSALL